MRYLVGTLNYSIYMDWSWSLFYFKFQGNECPQQIWWKWDRINTMLSYSYLYNELCYLLIIFKIKCVVILSLLNEVQFKYLILEKCDVNWLRLPRQSNICGWIVAYANHWCFIKFSKMTLLFAWTNPKQTKHIEPLFQEHLWIHIC